MKNNLLSLCTFITLLITPFISNAQLMPKIELVVFSNGYTGPVDIKHAGDSRLFIVEQRGRIYIADSAGNKSTVPFLDIMSIVDDTENEQGLLGLTFHPNYQTNGYFFVNYSASGGDTKIVRYSVSADPDLADATSGFELMTINQPYWNHNGGNLIFGPDGYLYIGTGDGGSSGDPQNRAQNPQTLLGKMLRIDVDSGSPYGIPANNPFVGNATTLDEIWAIGLRNPWRYSFDRQTGDLWIGDVGQNTFEEIDFEPDSCTGGKNYGWRCYEANDPYETSGCGPAADYVFPVYVYDNHFTSGCSVTGGYVYRGSEYTAMNGHYIFTDYCSGIFTSIWQDAGCGFKTLAQGNLRNFNYSTLGENSAGDLFVGGLADGIIYKIEDQCDGMMSLPAITHSGDTLLSTTAISHQWYFECNPITGATSDIYFPAQIGEYRVWVEDANGCMAFSDAFNYNPMGIPDVKQVMQISIHPNPFSDVARIYIGDAHVPGTELMISDLNGREVLSKSIVTNNPVLLDCSNLDSGIYFLSVSGSIKGFAKLVVQ